MVKIDELTKQRLLDIPVESVARALGISVTRHRALCFMHDDHHPSLGFMPGKNRWKCYVCDVWGDNISLVMRYNNQNFVEACVWLGNRFGIIIGNTEGVDTTVHQREPVKPRKENAKVEPDYEILEAIIEHFGLTKTARRFLFDERKYSEEVVNSLKVCAIDDEKDLLDFLCNKFGFSRLLKSQLAYKYGQKIVSYFHAPCIFFPYYNINGKFVGLQARYLGDSEKHQRFQYPKGMATQMFNMPALKTSKTQEPIFISEGVTDAIALMSSGYNAIAIPSATSFKSNEMHWAEGRSFMMYPDNDEPGERLFEQLKAAITSHSGSITRLYLPDGCKDYSELYKYSAASRK